MAASVYATPPPDLSGEDTALSDVSNSSQVSTSSSSQSKSTATKRSLSTALLTNSQNQITTNPYDLLQLQLLDQSKKRRKQSTPIRISALNLSSDVTATSTTNDNNTVNEADGGVLETDTTQLLTNIDDNIEDIEELPKLLPSPGKPDCDENNDCHEDTEAQNQKIKIELPKNDINIKNENVINQDNDSQTDERNINEQVEHNTTNSIARPKSPDSYEERKACQQCGETFDTDLKLGVHMLHEHANLLNEMETQYRQEKSQKLHFEKESTKSTASVQSSESPVTFPTLKVKTEFEMNELVLDHHQNHLLNPSRANPETKSPWLSAMPGLNFPFPPEAAAVALSASNYLSQLPLLSVPPVGAFASVEGLSRPPLRIFNPEAFCDLCNKEFCNKYFLKTHKANKHGIYDPTTGSSNDAPSGTNPGPLDPIQQVLQMQFQQQQQQHQQQQQQASQQQTSQQQQPQHSPQGLMPPEPAIFCEICHKRFNNVFAMKRHRSKSHEIPPPSSPNSHQMLKQEAGNNSNESGSNSSGGNNSNTGQRETECSTPLRMPEGFREDFTLEQEDVSFTPQPRKLSPASSQQARDANFAADKLKRLGVVNPEAFCDLCCKEYCNKYFLRTHKLKRHGILIPVDDIKDDKLNWQHFVQTTPLNLMMSTEKLHQRHPLSEVDFIQKIVQQKQLPTSMIDEIKASVKYNGLGGLIGQEGDDIMAGGGGLCGRIVNTDKSIDVLNKGHHEDGDERAHEMTNSSNHHKPSLMDEVMPPHQDPEAISVDLQKLQSMILQLNDLNNQKPVGCNLCGKELENQYMLHAHIITEHSSSGDNNNGGMKNSRSSSPTMSTNQNEICKQCDKEFPNLFELKQHIFEKHGLISTSPLREGFITPDRPITTGMSLSSTPIPADRRPPYTITPTSSYCEICNKELCNKYFMKTHMQRMHGIEIENGSQIGGVVCNICNKELCSKYFLRVHKHNTHGIVDEGSPLPQPRQNGDPIESPESLFGALDATMKGDISELGNRYFSHYTEVCPICTRRFRSAKWLRAHLMSDHGKAGTDKLREIEQQMNFSKPSSSPPLKIPNGSALNFNNLEQNLLAKGAAFSSLFMNDDSMVSSSTRIKEYQCSFCNFSTPYYAFLFIHERSHTFLNNPTVTNSTKSEAAVSIAKDQQRLMTQPSTAPVSSCSTPTTITPASTPIPQTPQENANGSKQQLQHQQQQQQLQLIHQRESAIPNANFLSDLANITNRPASYALPQGAEGEYVQSFFIEEAKTSDRSSSDGGNTPDGTGPPVNRFVPAVVFLPVKERISGPITVSFTLTPA